MNIDRAVIAIAGALVLLSIALSQLHSPWWLLLAAFMGFNLVQASLSGFCPAAWLFKRLGLPSGSAFASEADSVNAGMHPR